MPNALLLKVRKLLKDQAEPGKAKAMQVYMKSAMPYHGVVVPTVRKICKAQFKDIEFSDRADWEGQVLAFWRQARYREERYAALHLARAGNAGQFRTPAAMKVYEELIVSGAWWDFVDEIASHDVGFILSEHPSAMRRKLLAWSRSDDLWKRRTSIICQLHRQAQTDLDLLYACIEPSMSSREFFLRKAIGWALRQYARSDPQEVRRYVKAHAGLSALSRREAMKHLDASV